ncbi:uncharacterized protein Z519_01678 [Cladophialophora bantiana CBS 173.52]|uniref:NCS1 nucleoside transporter n=1 Tax=Cladophialophora bantiana (strain ATCC 10958 / CBS 173.52 / CDC B-1940 / NIH 8579) TaxID=1442370 RepID=A0A0D2IMV1_CLAB1|nr:uncharacterized protein Z519_01678 [Cladophialophora bantiana CBS 173.52]KIW98094.1 hypothetical protein Z519_01678 [Cladophialophora bantiana CBS 173.52]
MSVVKMDATRTSIQIMDEEKLSLQADQRPVDASFAEVGTAEALGDGGPKTSWQKFANWMETRTSVEVRGIERMPECSRQRKVSMKDFFQIGIVWFSANCTANNMTVSVLGPIEFDLGLKDAMLICAFGNIFGAMCTAYIVHSDPYLMNARYTMGWYPSRLAALFNVVVQIGWGLVDCLVAGLILSAVNGGGMTVIVGVIIAALGKVGSSSRSASSGFISMRGSYAWLPQICVLFIMVGTAGPLFDTSSASSGEGSVLACHRLTYFFLSASGALGWSACACDFFVYFPPKTSRWQIFLWTTVGLSLGKMFLYVEGLAPLNQFGKFCAVLLALGIVANNVAGIYAAALSFQLLDSRFARVPRVFWCTLSTVIFTVTTIAGRAHLLQIFINFLSLIGYWTIIWITMTLEEEFIFRRTRGGYDWSAWNTRELLPIGLAAITTFVIGWVGAIMCMDQDYYTGPIAALIGDGADIGLPVAASWTAIIYPGLRCLELKYIGR